MCVTAISSFFESAIVLPPSTTIMTHVRSVGKYRDIHQAARKGAIAEVNEFLDLGTDANVRRADGSTPLPVMILQRTFLEWKRRVAQPWTGFSFPRIALHFHDRMWAAHNAHPDIIALLISRGADVRIKDRDGLKAENYATGYDPGTDSQSGLAARQRRADETTKLLFLREIELQAESKLYRTRGKELWHRVSTSVAAKNFYKAQGVISKMQGILGTSSTNVSMLRKKSMRLQQDKESARRKVSDAAAAASASSTNLDDIGEMVEEEEVDDDSSDESS